MSVAPTPRATPPEHEGIDAYAYADLWDYHLGVAGEGPHAYNWSDKPHRLVYDLTRMCALERRTNAALREENERRAAAYRDMRSFHDAAIKELYRMLGVDGSDGEIRFKWAALALARKLDELAALRAELEAARKDAPRWLVRAGGYSYDTWLCTYRADVRNAFSEALFGSVDSAESHEIDIYMLAVDAMPAEELQRRWNFEDGWLEITRLTTIDAALQRDGGKGGAS